MAENYEIGLYHASSGELLADPPAAWSAVALVEDATPPSLEADDIDKSHQKTPNRTRVSDPGWADPGEVTVKIQHDSTKLSSLYALFRVKQAYMLLFGDQTTDGEIGAHDGGVKFDGYVKTIQPAPDGDKLAVNLTIKVSGGHTVIASQTGP